MEPTEPTVSSPPTPTSLEELVQRLGQADPTWGLIAQAMGRRDADQEERRRRSREAVERLRFERERLAERNDLLARALGACPSCWGEDTGCRLCRGRGKPGSWFPDDDAFGQFVVPF